MSMINDALRRARHGSRPPAAVPPPEPDAEAPTDFPPPPPMPVESAFPAPPPLAMTDDLLPPGLENEEPKAARSNTLQLVLAVFLVLAVSVVAVLNHWQKRTQDQGVDVSANAGRKAILPNASALRTAAQTLAAVSNRHAAASAPAATSTVATVPAPAPAPVVVAAPAPPPKFPALRLQSIYYRPANPSVMINGRTLFLDDEIQGVTVADIHPSSVTLVLSGLTNVLTLR